MDTVIRHTQEDMDYSLLPEENACFKILTEEIKLYVRKFDAEYFCTEYFDVDKRAIYFDEMFMYTDDDILGGKFERFIEWGRYYFELCLKRQLESSSNLGGKYIMNFEKTACLCQCDKLEQWKNDDVMNIVA